MLKGGKPLGRAVRVPAVNCLFYIASEHIFREKPKRNSWFCDSLTTRASGVEDFPSGKCWHHRGLEHDVDAVAIRDQPARI